MLLKLFAFLFLVHLTIALKLQLEKHVSPSQLILRQGKAKNFRQLRSSHFQKVKLHYEQLAKGGKSQITDYKDFKYSVNINFGSPPQYFKLLVDTNIALTWLPDSTYDNDKSWNDKICAKEPCFESFKSSSYVIDGRKFGNNPYQTNLMGFVGNDTIRLGDGDQQIVVKGSTFGQLTWMSLQLPKQPYEGVLGLAFNDIDNVEPVFQTAIKQGLVNQPIFTVWLKRDGPTAEYVPGGQLTFGSLDTEHCSPNVVYIPLSHETQFEFQIDATQVNNDKKRTGQWNAISDTGLDLIMVPGKVFEDISATTKASFNYQYGMWELDCKTKFSVTLFTNGQQIVIDEKIGLVQFAGSDLCFLGLENWFDYKPNFILGDNFMQEYCQIYDMTGKVGFSMAVNY